MLVGLVFLAVAGYLALRYSRNHPHHLRISRSADVSAIADWMALRYLSRAYGVPEPVLLAAVHQSEPEAQHRSLADLARLEHTTPDRIIAEIQAAIRQYWAHHPTPTPIAGALGLPYGRLA